MKIFVDTNVLISAFVFGGKTYQVLSCLLKSSDELLVSDYVRDEFKQKLAQKWKEKADKVFDIFIKLPFSFCASTSETLGTLRDKKDIPILSDAIFNNADMILTGDKDFLESGIENPRILSPNDMVDFLAKINKINV